MNDNILFWVMIVVFAPQVVILLDYIFKSLYIAYWDFVYQNRMDVFIENLGTNKISVRRRTIDGLYIISSYPMYTDRPYEYVADGKGNVSLFGGKSKIIKPFVSNAFISPCSMKILERDKSNYVNLINNYIDKNSVNCDIIEFNGNLRWGPKSPIIGPLKLAHKCDIKKMGVNSFIPTENDYLIRHQDVKIQEELDKLIREESIDEDKDIRILAIKTYNKIRRNGEPDIEKLIKFAHFISQCVEGKLKTEDEINRFITELIYNRVYGYTTI